jgi:hypothetical protein
MLFHPSITVEKAVRLQVFLTTLEVAVMGFFLLRIQSLGETALLDGYSLPRLILIASWLIGLCLCLWAMYSTVKRNADFDHLLTLVDQLKQPDYYSRWWEWLLVAASVSWVSVFLKVFLPDFWSFLWPGLPVLIGQYLPVIVILGIWLLQSLILLMRLSKPIETDKSMADGTSAAKAISVFLLAFVLYAGTAVYLGVASESKKAYFPELAQSFLQGRLDIAEPALTKDLTLFNGKYYVAFPPLPALLMMPFVAMHGSADFNILLFQDGYAALGVMFAFLMLEAMRRLDWNRLRWWENVLLALFFGFGTAQYFLSVRGLVNFTSQILTATFVVLSLWISFAGARQFNRMNALLVGSSLGLAMLARPNVLFVWIAVAVILIDGTVASGKFSIARYFQWLIFSLIPIFVVVIGLFWYNQVRFGSPFDFGYTHMLVAERLESDLAAYGQFHPHFIAENLYDNYLRLPYWDTKCQQLAPNPQGMSIFLVSPLVIYLYLAMKKRMWVMGAWLSIGLIALTHALYYNSGEVQFGYRFSLDFMPLVITLLAFGFRDRLTRFAIFLIALSVILNFFGALWIVHRWCVNF